MRRNQRLSGSGLSAGPLKPATVHQAYRALRRTLASAVENDILVRIHDLRHRTASLAIAAGADVKTLQTMLGHASAVMTLDPYGHLMPGAAEDAAARLDILARTTEPEPIRAAVRLDARDFRGMRG